MTGRPPWRDVARARVERRMELRLSAAIVAQRLGVSVQRFSAMERGVSRPSDTLDREWADALYREAP